MHVVGTEKVVREHVRVDVLSTNVGIVGPSVTEGRGMKFFMIPVQLVPTLLLSRVVSFDRR